MVSSCMVSSCGWCRHVDGVVMWMVSSCMVICSLCATYPSTAYKSTHEERFINSCQCIHKSISADLLTILRWTILESELFSLNKINSSFPVNGYNKNVADDYWTNKHYSVVIKKGFIVQEICFQTWRVHRRVLKHPLSQFVKNVPVKTYFRFITLSLCNNNIHE